MTPTKAGWRWTKRGWKRTLKRLTVKKKAKVTPRKTRKRCIAAAKAKPVPAARKTAPAKVEAEAFPASVLFRPMPAQTRRRLGHYDEISGPPNE